ncbi:MAG: hypothetical protein RIN55_12495 [Tissierellaceae bacterium]|nr:hypothetical protein [Tissierellaceae bacterium]
MPFILPKDSRRYFQNIFDPKNKDGKKLKLNFDIYYFCLMVGLACGKYEKEPELDPNSQIDEYPADYLDSRDYVAGLLIATEAKGRGIAEDDAIELERLMVEYIDSTSKTRLNTEGERRLNQYAARGMEMMQEKLVDKPYRLEVFLLDYYQCFTNGEFTDS